MKTTQRFERAVSKLYTAFHKGTLNAFHCEACAVGNIVGHGNWIGYYPSKFDLYHNFFNENFENHDNYPKSADYAPEELKKIEFLFLKEHCGVQFSFDSKLEKECQFKGLCAVVEYLCELDGIPNVMDYSSLFETDEKGVPVKQLEECFS